MPIIFWIVLFVVVAGILYWLLVVTEGVYLGQRVVTWLYDITANRYEEIKQFDARAEAMIIGSPLNIALQLDEKPIILDIGTGTGRVAQALLNEQGAVRGFFVGIDASLRMLHRAARNLGDRDNIIWLWDDSSQLPFPDEMFHAVTCLEMLEFTPSPLDQLREATRVLCLGGFVADLPS